MKVPKVFLKDWKSGLFVLSSVSLLLDPDPHSQYGSGSRRAKSVRVHPDSDPQLSHALLLDPDPHSQYGTDPDPGEPNQCGSIRIHNTVGFTNFFSGGF
jgi:hypothetical protein